MGRKKKVSEEKVIAFGDGQTHLEGRKHKKWSKRYGKKYDRMVKILNRQDEKERQYLENQKLKASKKLYGVKTPFKGKAADKVLEKVIADQEYIFDNFEEGAYYMSDPETGEPHPFGGINRRLGKWIDINIPGRRDYGQDREDEFKVKYKETRGSKRRKRRVEKLSDKMGEMRENRPSYSMKKGGEVKKKTAGDSIKTYSHGGYVEGE